VKGRLNHAPHSRPILCIKHPSAFWVVQLPAAQTAATAYFLDLEALCGKIDDKQLLRHCIEVRYLLFLLSFWVESNAQRLLPRGLHVLEGLLCCVARRFLVQLFLHRGQHAALGRGVHQQADALLWCGVEVEGRLLRPQHASVCATELATALKHAGATWLIENNQCMTRSARVGRQF
jgi:hypothetical protein